MKFLITTGIISLVTGIGIAVTAGPGTLALIIAGSACVISTVLFVGGATAYPFLTSVTEKVDKAGSWSKFLTRELIAG